MRILSIANQKGGVGKTATAHILGSILAESKRVLLVDCDPQASLTAETLGTQRVPNLAFLLEGRGGVIYDVGENLDLIPAGIELASVELGLVSKLGRENQLKKVLESKTDYDYILIDCPPSLGLLTINALVASDSVLVPTRPHAQDVRGVSLFLETVDQVTRELNPGLSVLGVLVTFYDTRINHHQNAIQAMKDAGLPVLNTLIGQTVKIAEAAGNRQAVTDYDPSNRQSEAYRQLAKEVFDHA